ncbi:glycoside hydrolase family 5 protein [Lignipirellula cremea]|uniref:Endoglucanase A n=1 Tax=Lignipirellula cremea TaxID=2528010 RepID=A0A518DQ62_9BACT|nr:glycoside hydrolase family 5 protein [Lignipirellula cremea]QDU93996.1 Endoglucanase A precursor [Lignipirellula cremea]
MIFFHAQQRCLAMSLFLLGPFLLIASAAAAPPSIVANSGMEIDADSDQWPDGWARLKEGGSWQVEDGNHFLRLQSTAPGAMVMLYQEIGIPAGVEAIEMTWRQRVTGLQVGKQSWFDARFLMEFLDPAREKVTPTPRAPSSRKDTDGWVEKSTQFLVPEGARTLKFMPCLFQVNAGSFDLDDIVLKPIPGGPLREAAAVAAAALQAKLAAQASQRQAKAAAALEAEGSLISNGDFETDVKKADGWPDHWGQLKDAGSWETEGDNHFLRMKSPTPGKLVMVYRTFDIPAGTAALELSWKQRVTGLKKGAMPWFDARIMLEFMGVDGKKLGQKPSPPYTQKDTDGWVEKSKSFLVPEGALTLAMMPSLFQVQAGTLDLDDFVLKPTDPAPLFAAAEKRAAEVQARYVAPEEPNRANWPLELKVVGNRLHDTNGKEVWLQGVNAGGLETLPQDKQAIKSVVVAIDDWKANCVRVPMKESFWYGESPYQNDGGKEYRETLDQIITLAANRGAYVVIDLHRFRAPRQEHADFWKEFAGLYKDHPAVLFDLFNEPHGISWEVWRNGGFVSEKSGTDESAFLTDEEKKKNQGYESIGMQALVDAVRSSGAKNVVIAGGVFWCNDLSGVVNGHALKDPTGNGIMYSWHTYNWHTGWEAKVLPTAEKHPIFLGEVGADIHKMNFIPLEDQEDPYTWVPDMLGFIQKHRLNWTGWCLHPGATPLLISDWSYTPTPYWGVFAKEALSGKQFELKRTR